MSPKDKLASFGIGITAVLMMMSLSMVNPFTFILAYFIPFVFFVSSIMYGIAGILISTATALTVIGIFFGLTTSFEFLLINSGPAIWLTIRQKFFYEKSYLGKFIAEISVAGVIIYLFSNIFYSEKFSLVKKIFNQTINTNFESKITISETLINLIPSIVIASWIAILFVNLILSQKFIYKIHSIKSYNKNYFTNLFLPGWIIYFFIIFLVLSVLLKEPYVMWAQSISIILVISITLQGLATIQSLINKFKISNILTGLFYIIALFIPFILAIIAAIGVLEHFYNFRKFNYSNLNQ